MKDMIDMQVIKCHEELHKPHTKPLHSEEKKMNTTKVQIAVSRMCGYRTAMPQNSDYLTTSSEKWLLLAFLMASDLHKPGKKYQKFNTYCRYGLEIYFHN